MNGEIYQAVSFIASIVSLILAIGAIWLSIVFFKMSDNASRATTEASKGISASVERLEKLFDKLYSDTFSMMRDTVDDMRKHIWKVPDGNIDEKDGVISKIIKTQGVSRVAKVPKSSGAEVDKKLVNQILISIRALKDASVDEIAEYIDEPEDVVVRALFHMRREGLVTWDGKRNTITTESIVKIRPSSDEEASPADDGGAKVMSENSERPD